MGKTRYLFPKISDTKGTFHANMGSIKHKISRADKNMQEEAMGSLVSVGCRSHQGNKMLGFVSWMIFKRKIHKQQELWVWGTRQLFLLTIKDLHDPDNHSGVITHLKPDILECGVKWASGSITRTKLVEVMEFQLSSFKSQSDAVKVLHSICQQIWKTQQ